MIKLSSVTALTPIRHRGRGRKRNDTWYFSDLRATRGSSSNAEMVVLSNCEVVSSGADTTSITFSIVGSRLMSDKSIFGAATSPGPPRPTLFKVSAIGDTTPLSLPRCVYRRVELYCPRSNK
ncbi:hypothetical protein M0802_014259 [Mischocyttarus mexicanus]|nr:hypothetical protein M0802_014262 [Mischocyttarus mexicanus]KAI4480402.1 hypothetical protein M0802_014259 [Mischocyttarus mexicanus]